MIGDIVNRFKLLIFEPAEKYLARKKKEEAERQEKIAEYMRTTGGPQFCDGCDSIELYLRWVYDGETCCCYNCFIESLACEADVMVPMRNVTQMNGYVTEDIWNELWEEENGFV